MHLTAPSLFRPAPWWRLPRWADITQYAGNLKQGSGGHLSYRVSGGLAGHLVHCPGCADCAGTDPGSFTVVIAGVTGCSCIQRGAGAYYSQLRDVNGTYTLTQRTDALCSWLYFDASATAFARQWTNSACNVTAATNTGMAIQLTRTEGVGRKWNLTVANGVGSFTASAYNSGDQTAIVNVCNEEEMEWANANANCTGGDRTATGGTATITPD
jgi:hypothetical protein